MWLHCVITRWHMGDDDNRNHGIYKQPWLDWLRARSIRGGTWRLGASRFAGASWPGPDAVSEALSTGEPEIAVDRFGNAIAVWNQTSETGFRAMASNYRAGWATPTELEPRGADHIRAACGQNGNAIAVWDYYDETTRRIRASLLSNGSWSSPIDISGTASGLAAEPRVACDAMATRW
jgi:hypothetical protein